MESSGKKCLDQALNVKEFAVAAAISYSSAREWFRFPGFPALNGFVFWSDFVSWRRTQTGVGGSKTLPPPPQPNGNASVTKTTLKFPARASRVLLEAG
jgi:hypothetical protein